jgi:hypothetical protein
MNKIKLNNNIYFLPIILICIINYGYFNVTHCETSTEVSPTFFLWFNELIDSKCTYDQLIARLTTYKKISMTCCNLLDNPILLKDLLCAILEKRISEPLYYGSKDLNVIHQLIVECDIRIQKDVTNTLSDLFISISLLTLIFLTYYFGLPPFK